MNYKLSASEIRELIVAKLSHNFGVTPAEATDEHYYKAVVLILRDLMTEGRKEFIDQAEKEDRKQVYYLCMEFLMGRSLRNNLYNLGLELSLIHISHIDPGLSLPVSELNQMRRAVVDSGT